ncbi:MAG: hypothetical protein J3K34DRAFT_527415 [Monoraphidium minutum]|nr:MAG: hypothetical protein J3K34DRAFT_527415 [Monoraphidium minutum]
MSAEDRGNKTPNEPVKEQIAQDKFGKSYDELSAHERVQIGGTKGGIVTKGGPGTYEGHYEGEGTRTGVENTGDAAKMGGGGQAE